MRFFQPLNGVRKPLHYFLLIELPTLVITFSLLAWGVAALRDALRFQKLSGRWRGGPDEQSGYGLEYGTQLITRTSTRTGTSYAYSLVPSTWTYTSSSRGASTTVPVTTEIPTSRRSAYSSTVGTSTTTYTMSIYPAVYGTAFYSDVYQEAGIQPTEAVQVSHTRSTATPTSAPLAAREVRWSDGYNYESSHDGLYDTYDEAEADYTLFIGLFSGCVAVVILRFLVSVAYLIACHIYNGPAHKSHLHSDRMRSLRITLHALNTILAFSVIGWVALCGLGITAWLFFGTRSDGLGADVSATLVFYALTTSTTFVVLVMSARRVDCLNKERKKLRRDMGGDIALSGEKISSHSSLDHSRV